MKNKTSALARCISGKRGVGGGSSYNYVQHPTSFQGQHLCR